MNILRPFLTKNKIDIDDLLPIARIDGNELLAAFRQILNEPRVEIHSSYAHPMSWMYHLRTTIADVGETGESKSQALLNGLDERVKQILTEEWLKNDRVVVHRVSAEETSLLEKLRAAERVHPTDSFEVFHSRAMPPRRIFTLEHPSLSGLNMPAAFVCTALVSNRETECGSIPYLLQLKPWFSPNDVRVAVFYSISSIEPGLHSIRVGKKLLEKLLQRLQMERDTYPRLDTFLTLSPIPSFCKYLRTHDPELHRELSSSDVAARGLVQLLDTQRNQFQRRLEKNVAKYILQGDTNGKRDPVAAFHLSNGASLSGIHFLADASSRRLDESFGMMVNYQYIPDQLKIRASSFISDGKVAFESRIQDMI